MFPERIRLKNFQSYAESTLDFDFNSTLIIGELDDQTDLSNGAGKSTIFEAIAWALFGQSKQSNADGVVKRGTDFCEVDFEFEHNGKHYVINRKRNSRYSRAEVQFWEKKPDGTLDQIKGDTNTEINEHIKGVIKSNYEVFVNSSYFMQKAISDFMSGTTSDRQKIVSAILNLDRWNKYLKEASKKVSEHEKKVGQLEFKLKGLENVEKDLVESEIQLKTSRIRSEELNSKDEKLAHEILELEKRLTNLKAQESSLNDYHDTVSRLDNVKSRIKELKATIVEKSQESEKLSEKIASNNSTIAQLKTKIEEISAPLDLKNHIDMPAIEKELNEHKTKLSWYVKQVALWKPEDKCKCCNKPWVEHKEKVSEYESNLKESKVLETRLAKFEEKARAARASIEKIKQTEVEIEKYTSRNQSLEANNEINTLKRDVAVKELAIAQESLEKETHKEVALNDRLEGMKEIGASNTFEKVRLLLKAKKSEREQVIKDKNEVSYTVGGLTQKVEQLTISKAEKIVLSQDLTNEIKMFTVYTTLVRSFGRNGIQAIIIDNVIEELTKTANEWLNQFCYEPTYVRFVTQKQDSKGGWKETLDIEVISSSGVCDFDSLSGGEAFKVAFAIRLALSQIQARRMGGESQLLLLDEVSSSLDKHGLDMFIAIIRKLEKTIKVMVVTHDDNLKDQFDHVIKVKKTGRDSVLTVL